MPESQDGIGSASIDLDRPFFVTFRAYVEKDTKVGLPGQEFYMAVLSSPGY